MPQPKDSALLRLLWSRRNLHQNPVKMFELNTLAYGFKAVRGIRS